MNNRQISEKLGQLHLRLQELILAGKVRCACDHSVIPYTNYQICTNRLQGLSFKITVTDSSLGR